MKNIRFALLLIFACNLACSPICACEGIHMKEIPYNYSHIIDSGKFDKISAEQIMWLNEDWKPFYDAGVIKRYCISNNNDILLYIFTVEYSQKAWDCSKKQPKPVICDSTGRIIGELPQIFPVEDAWELEITLKSWYENWPNYITLYIYDAAVSYDHPVEGLFWGSDDKKYHYKSNQK